MRGLMTMVNGTGPLGQCHGGDGRGCGSASTPFFCLRAYPGDTDWEVWHFCDGFLRTTPGACAERQEVT